MTLPKIDYIEGMGYLLKGHGLSRLDVVNAVRSWLWEHQAADLIDDEYIEGTEDRMNRQWPPRELWVRKRPALSEHEEYAWWADICEPGERGAGRFTLVEEV